MNDNPNKTMTELIKFQKARLEKNRLVIDDRISIDEWKELGQALKQVEGSVQFWIGDWARFGEKKGFTGKYVSPQVYDDLQEITGLERHTIQQYKQVADATSCTRVQDLSFSHHREVAALDETKQQNFLQQASEEKLSVRELKERIKHSEVVVVRGLSERLQAEKELKEIARNINNNYSKEHRKYFISLIKI